MKEYRYVYGKSVDNYGIIQTREVKKMKYLEVKVVKVKKRKPLKTNWRIDLKDPLNPYCECPKCGETLTCKNNEPIGNWVNGENLDKIKFPCFCKWSDNGWIGMLIKNWKNCEAVYTIVRIDQQTKKSETYGSFKDLKEFIKDYHIHILKGKIIIFDDTLENGKYDIDIEEE